VITAYGVAFGGLLLVGGRLGDLWGRKRVFLIGLVGCALASFGCAAVNTGMLLGARALQGVFAALLAPGPSPTSDRTGPSAHSSASVSSNCASARAPRQE